MLIAVYKKVMDLLVTPCLEEEESYAVRSRKLGTIFLSFICINGLFLGVPVNVAVAIQDYNIGSLLTAISMFIAGIFVSIVPYVYLRHTRRLSQWMVDLQVWSAVIPAAALILFNPESDSSTVVMLGALSAIVLQVRGLWVLFSMFLILTIFYRLRAQFGEEIPQLQIFTRHSLLYERITYSFGNYLCPIIFFAFGLYNIIREFIVRSNQADAAIAMNLAVANKLRHYDTASVAEILAANEGRVDEKLLIAFADIQRNLQEYRPHIPNYVIAATSGAAEETDATDEAVVEDDVSEGDIDLGKVPSGNATRVHSMNVLNTSLRSALNSQHSDTGSETHSQHSDIPSEKVLPSLVRPGIPACFHGRVTTVFARLLIPPQRGALGIGTITTINQFVESTAHFAKVHGGALQYMQGYALMISFIGASRSSAHECKACGFAVALKRSCDEREGDVAVHISVVTSSANAFFAGGSGQLLMTVVGNHMETHSRLQQFLVSSVGSSVSAVVASQSTITATETRFTSRPVGAVVGAEDDAVYVVHEVVDAVTAKDQDEWMYQLQHQQQTDPHSAIKTAVELALKGLFEEAPSLLVDNSVLDSLYHCLSEKIKKCAQNQTATFPLRLPQITNLW